MYGLSASGYIANQDLRKHLAKYNCYATKRTGSKYVGIDLDWDYEKREVKLSMKGVRKTSITAIPTPNTNKVSLWTNKIRTTGIQKENTIQYGGHITRNRKSVANSCMMEDQ